MIPDAKVTFTNLDTGFFQVPRTDKNGQFLARVFYGNYEFRRKQKVTNHSNQNQGLFATQSNRVIPVPIRLEEQAVKTEPVAGVQPTPSPVIRRRHDWWHLLMRGWDWSDTPDLEDLAKMKYEHYRRRHNLDTNFWRTRTARSWCCAATAGNRQVGRTGLGGGRRHFRSIFSQRFALARQYFTVDGSDNNDEDIGVRRQGFFSLVPQPIESIQEFSIITLLAPAEFGRNLGAQVNAISKRGTNRFNGTLYALFNSSKLNARNFFDNAGGNTSMDLRSFQRPAPFPSDEVPVFVNGSQARVFTNAGRKTLGHYPRRICRWRKNNPR